MIVFAAYVPHSPFLIESIGKDKTKQLKKTLKGLKTIEHNLYASMPDTVIFIGGHSNIEVDSFSLSVGPRLSTGFKDVGDYQVTSHFNTDTHLNQLIREHFIHKQRVIYSHKNQLDYAISTPLTLLMSKMTQTKIVALHHTMENAPTHFEFGKELREVLEHTNKRVAIIATGDLSHCLTPDAPGGFSEYGKAFDDLIKQQIKKPPYKKLLGLPDDFIINSQECGLRQLTLLLGIISEYQYKADQLSYEAPFGVGYLTVQFILR